jgi:hypothetical protein
MSRIIVYVLPIVLSCTAVSFASTISASVSTSYGIPGGGTATCAAPGTVTTLVSPSGVPSGFTASCTLAYSDATLHVGDSIHSPYPPFNPSATYAGVTYPYIVFGDAGYFATLLPNSGVSSPAPVQNLTYTYTLNHQDQLYLNTGENGTGTLWAMTSVKAPGHGSGQDFTLTWYLSGSAVPTCALPIATACITPIPVPLNAPLNLSFTLNATATYNGATTPSYTSLSAGDTDIEFLKLTDAGGNTLSLRNLSSVLSVSASIRPTRPISRILWQAGRSLTVAVRKGADRTSQTMKLPSTERPRSFASS